MSIKFTNNATATLAASITTSSTSLTVTTGQGALFPTLAAGDYFYATLVDSSNNIEIVKITARSSDTLTATRAQEGTTARAYAAADKLELRVTAAALTNFATQDGPNTFSAANNFTVVPTFSGGALPVTSGGTNATTATAARTSLAAVGQNGTETLIGSVAGTSTITGTVTPAITSYVTGQIFKFVAAASNIGAVTINLNSLGAKAITKFGSTALASNDILIGAVVQIIYDGTQFQLTSGVATGTGLVAGGVIFENFLTISANYTITTNKNAHSVGPIILASGVTLTVPTGSRYVVL
jgi:hypothetical protein